jgi:O-antigen/teichoic acid export membrane protein
VFPYLGAEQDLQDIKRRLMTGTVWLGSARGLSNLIGVINTIVLARLLTPADFGLVALAMTMLALLTASTEMSLSAALVQHKEPTEAHYDTVFTLSIVRASVLAAIFAAIAYPVAVSYGDFRLFGLMLALSAMTVVGSLFNPKMVTLTRSLVFWQEFVLTIAQKVAGFLVAVAVAVLFRSYWAIVLGLCASQVVNVALSYLIVPYRPRFGWQHARELFSFSGWLTLNSALATLNYKLDPLMIGWFLGRAQLGIYSVGDNLASLPIREAMTPLNQTLFPAFSRVKGDMVRLRAAVRSAQGFICFIALPVGFGFSLVSDTFVRLALGEHWLEAVFIIQTLSIIVALNTMVSALFPVALALGETKFVFQRQLMMFCIRVPAVVAGMYLAGLPGVVMGRLLTGVFGLGVNLHMMKRLIGVTVTSQLGTHWRTLTGVVVMAAVVAILDHVIGRQAAFVVLAAKLAVLVIAGAVTYLAVCFGLWIATGRQQGAEAEIRRLLGRVPVWIGKRGAA